MSIILQNKGMLKGRKLKQDVDYSNSKEIFSIYTPTETVTIKYSWFAESSSDFPLAYSFPCSLTFGANR
jgi:hypothetical protein